MTTSTRRRTVRTLLWAFAVAVATLIALYAVFVIND